MRPFPPDGSAPPGPGLVARKAWGEFRRRQLHAEYAERRERYAALAAARGLRYDESGVPAAARARLARRGYTPVRRAPGEIHTFTFIPRIGWHAALLPDLAELGPVTEFDYAALGYTPQELFRRDRSAERRQRELNDRVLPALRAAHARRPVDWVFVYASGLEIRAETVRAITEELGIPVVNMCLDDKQSWESPGVGGQRFGQIDIAAAFDLAWTSARVACEWYLVEGGVPVYMPEGFDRATYRPMPVTRDIPVSFIGGAYGFRPSVVRHLRRHGIPIQVFGPGWGTESVWGDEQVRVINRSVVNLGMGGIGYSERLTNVKTRDFEIPGVGGGAYLTTYSADLAQHYVIGREILCYQSRDELVELLRYYLARPDEAMEIARLGRERCLAEHRWLHRYERVCRILGILPDQPIGAERARAARDVGARV